jgi:hypothetical protein
VLAGALLAAAAAAGIVAAATWRDAAIEGAYFNRSVGQPAYSGVYSFSDTATGRIWLGVAIGLAASGLLVLAVSVAQTRRRSAAAPGP